MKPTTKHVSSSGLLTWPLASTALEALQPLVLVVAFQLGSTRLVNGHNPINFCNGLLFGNAFSLVTLLLIKRATIGSSLATRKDFWRNFRQVTPSVAINATCEVLLLIALSRVAAVQVALAEALGTVVLLLLIAGQKRHWPMPIALLGSGLVVMASVLTAPADQPVAMMNSLAPIGLNLLPNTLNANTALLAALMISSAIYYQCSAQAAEDLGSVRYGIWQTSLQTIIFLVWATTTFGLRHLYDLQSPLLWIVMLIYGGLISTTYTLVETQALVRAGALRVSMFEGLLPLFSGLIAWVLLQEPFALNSLIGAIIAAIGIACVELG